VEEGEEAEQHLPLVRWLGLYSRLFRACIRHRGVGLDSDVGPEGAAAQAVVRKEL